MNFLAIDTSGRRLIAAAKGKKVCVREADAYLRSSVVLFDAIGEALEGAEISLKDCDFLACVVGPGSFTGVRIGISAVKGMCMGADLPALSLTSFDVTAYAETGGKKLALVDAGHDHYYACRYDGTTPEEEPRFLTRAETEAAAEGYEAAACEPLLFPARVLSASHGLLAAAEGLFHRAAPASSLCALYLRKSSAEEKR